MCPWSQPGWMRLRSVLCIAASRIRVHSHIYSPAPHSVSLWAVVSFFPHSVQSSVSTNRILCSVVFVGSKSWITVSHADLAPSDVGMLWRLFHNFYHSIPGWICVMRTSRGGVAVVAVLLRVPYIRRLNCRSVSSCLVGSKYAHSRAEIQRYSKVRGILNMFGGFPSGFRRFHLWSHAAVRVPSFAP